MKWPERDYMRWHVTPDHGQFNSVPVYDIVSRKETRAYRPRLCEIHFCTIAECMWSFYSGPGYPLERNRHLNRPYWAYMAKLNQRWRYAGSKERQ